MHAWIATLIVFNILDAVSTLLGIQSGLFYEANPLMAWLIETSPILFLSVKCLACLPLAGAWVKADTLHWSVTIPLKGLTVVYGILIVWHCIGWYVISRVFAAQT